MRLVHVTYAEGGKVYTYRLPDGMIVQVDDWVIPESSQKITVVCAIETIDDLGSSKYPDPLNMYPLVQYHIDRSPERAEAARLDRIRQIRKALADLKEKADRRQALEEMALAGGAEGKLLLKELDKLESN